MYSNGVKFNSIWRPIGLNFSTFAEERREFRPGPARRMTFQAHPQLIASWLLKRSRIDPPYDICILMTIYMNEQ